MAKKKWQPDPKGWPSGKDWCKRKVNTREEEAGVREKKKARGIFQPMKLSEWSYVDASGRVREADLGGRRWWRPKDLPLLREIVAFLEVCEEDG